STSPFVVTAAASASRSAYANVRESSATGEGSALIRLARCPDESGRRSRPTARTALAPPRIRHPSCRARVHRRPSTGSYETCVGTTEEPEDGATEGVPSSSPLSLSDWLCNCCEVDRVVLDELLLVPG